MKKIIGVRKSSIDNIKEKVFLKSINKIDRIKRITSVDKITCGLKTIAMVVIITTNIILETG